MIRTAALALAFALLALASAPARAGSVQTPTSPGAWCTANPGLNRSSVICDYPNGVSHRFNRAVRVQVILYLRAHGQLDCAVTTTYDPTIDSIRDGRVLETRTLCY